VPNRRPDAVGVAASRASNPAPTVDRRVRSVIPTRSSSTCRAPAQGAVPGWMTPPRRVWCVVTSTTSRRSPRESPSTGCAVGADTAPGLTARHRRTPHPRPRTCPQPARDRRPAAPQLPPRDDRRARRAPPPTRPAPITGPEPAATPRRPVPTRSCCSPGTSPCCSPTTRPHATCARPGADPRSATVTAPPTPRGPGRPSAATSPPQAHTGNPWMPPQALMQP
jgi:hypothetical protein